MKATTIMAAVVAALSALAGAAQAHEPYEDRSAPPAAAYSERHAAWAQREQAETQEIHLSDSFFAGAGGVGPAFVESGGYGGDGVYVFSTANVGGRAFAHASAFASARAFAHVRIGGHGGHHGCGCH